MHTEKKELAVLSGILLLAALLRIYGIADESLWIDEGQTVTYAVQSFHEIVRYCARDVHPPLYLFLMKAWTDIFGISEVALRMPSALFGIAVVWMTWLVGRRLSGEDEQYRTVGILSALFIAVSYMAINFSQEARSYTLLLFSILMACHALLVYMSGPTRKGSLYYAASVALMLYVHTFTVFIILFHQLYVFFMLLRSGHFWKRAVHWVGVNVLALAFFGPWMYFLVMQILAKLGGEGPGSWVQVPDIYVAYRTFIQLAGGVYPLLVVGFICAAALLFYLKTQRKASATGVRSGLFLSLWFLCSVVLPFMVSLFLSPIYVERYAIQFLPGACIFLAFAIQFLPEYGRKIAVVAFIGATCVTLFQYYTMLDKEQWREVAVFLQKHVKEGEPVVLSAPWIYEPLVYYMGDDGEPRFVQAFSHVDIDGETRHSGKVWLVQAHEFFSDPNGRIPAMLGAERGITLHKDFKEGIETNPILVHFQSIRVTRFDGGLSGNEYLKQNPFAGRAQLVSGIPDSWLQVRQNVAVSQDGSGAKLIRIGANSRLKYALASTGKVGEGGISFWVKPEWTKTVEKRVLFMGKGSSWDRNTVFLETTDKDSLRAIFFGHTGYIGMCEGAPLSWGKGQWHQVALSWSRSGVVLYVDGQKYAEGALQRPFQAEFVTLHMGSDHQNRFIAPALYDDMTVYSVPLLPDAVAALFKGQVNIKADYAFDFDLKGITSADHLEEVSGFAVSAETPFFSKVPSTLSASMERGEFVFDFTPDWDGTDGKQHVLLTLFGKRWNNGSLFLEKTPEGFLQVIRWEGGAVSSVFGQDIKNWKKGEKHSLSLRWSPTHLMLSVDGRKYNGESKPAGSGAFRFLIVGNNDSYTLSAEGVFKGLKYQ